MLSSDNVGVALLTRECCRKQVRDAASTYVPERLNCQVVGKVHEAVPDENHVGGRQTVLHNIDGLELSGGRAVLALELFDLLDDVASGVPNPCQIHSTHPEKVTAGHI